MTSVTKDGKLKTAKHTKPEDFPPGSLRALEASRRPKVRGNRAASLKMGAVCGAKKRGGGKCMLAAGWGTEHKGIGACKRHGGSFPNHMKNAISKEAVLFGIPVEINPLDAILKMIAIRHGEVVWLTNEMALLDKEDWIEDTAFGKQFNLRARERRFAMNDVVRWSQTAVSLGIAERHIKMRETYGELLANMIKSILDGLMLTPEQQAIAPQVVRAALMSVDSSMIQTDGQVPQLTVVAGE